MHQIAFIGFRHSHILGLYEFAQKSPMFSITGACEENAAARTVVRRDGKVNLTHRRYAAMLDEVECDIVAVGDYYGRRGKLIIEALRRSKHVVADKPICTRLSELSEIERLARKNRLSVFCQLDMRGFGQFLKARELVSAGAIGEIHAIHVTGQHPLMLGSRPGWYFEKGKHGGTINDIAIHAFDFIPWLTGLQFAEIVAARTWNAFATPHRQFKDAAQFLLKMNNGAGIFGDVSYFMPDSQGYTLPQYWRTTLYGRAGVIEIGANLPGVWLARAGEKTPQTIPASQAKPFYYLEALTREITGKKTGLALTTHEVLAASRLALSVQFTADNSRKVNL
ncbi:MAG: Gfo/Idh/MocA family oxidoreductase [Verrucomicrobiota bacterium]